MNFSRAPPHIQALPGYSTQIPSRGRFWANQHAIEQDALNGVLNPPDIVKMVREMGFSFTHLVQTEDESSKYPRNQAEIWALYGTPVGIVQDAVGVTAATLKLKAWEFGNHEDWPPSSDGTTLTVLAQGYDGFAIRRNLFRVPRGRTFAALRAQIQQDFHFPAEEEVTLYFELEGVRRGPIHNQQQWTRCVRLAFNHHKINLYLTNVAAV